MEEKTIIRFNFGHESCDFIIQVDNCELHCHKSVLKENSNYFRLMFRQELSETKTSKVEIDLFEFESIWLLLHYLYRNPLDLHECQSIEIIIDTVFAAEYLMIENLDGLFIMLRDKIICSKLLLYELHSLMKEKFSQEYFFVKFH